MGGSIFKLFSDSITTWELLSHSRADLSISANIAIRGPSS